MAPHDSEPLLACSVCGLSQAEVVKIIAGPGVFLCDGCVALATDVLAAGETRVAGPAKMAPVPPSDSGGCSFCLSPRATVRGMVAGDGVRTCRDCLDLCHKILVEQRP